MDNIKVILFVMGIFVSLVIGVILTHITDEEKYDKEGKEQPQNKQDIDLELGLNKNNTPCEYLRNFTVEIMENNQPIMNIDTELRQRITWVN